LRHGEARGAAVCGNKVRADLSEWGSDAGEDGPASAVGAADTIPAPGTADGFAEGATTDTVAEGVAEGVVGEPTDGTDATAPPGVLTADGFTEGPTTDAVAEADGFAEGATMDTVAEGATTDGAEDGDAGEPTDGSDPTAPPGVLTADGFTEGPTPEGAGTASITVGATGVVPTALGDVFRSFGDPV
jgi:hypothetical protein